MAVRKKIIETYGYLPILKRYEILERINALDNIRDRALVAFLYLTGCRIEEVVKYYWEAQTHRRLKIKKGQPETKDLPIPIKVLKGEPIKKKQLEFKNDVIIIQDVRSLKRGKYEDSKRVRLRNVPIFIAPNEMPFIEIVQEYIKTKGLDDPLFDMTRQRASQILNKIGMFNHYLRHIRDTHLVLDYGFSAAELKQYNNWASSITADNYVHLNIDNLIDKMRGKK